jgi:hypothetical protein
VIAELGWVLHCPIAAVTSQVATRLASAVGPVVLAVVALFGALFEAVTTIRRQSAVGVAAIVPTHVAGTSAITLLARVEHGVAALELASGVADTTGGSVERAIIALLW